jgi:hypothetical protein
MNMTDPLQLKCGNPETAENENIPAATFSRFVFPFAYRLEKSNEQLQGLFYRVNDDSIHPRRKKYLTNETALVLFERAKWFEIDTQAWQKTPWETNAITVTLKNGDFKIKMLPPALVLFEFAEPRQTAESNTLETGFLYVDMYFPEQSPLPTFDDVLLFNELFRYFDMPYAGHVAAYKKCLKDIPIEYPVNNGHYRKLNDADCNAQESYFVRWLNFLTIPVRHNDDYYTLIPDACIDAAENWIGSSKLSKESCLVHVDNRCYVWTAALINGGGCALNQAFNNPPKPNAELQPHHYGHWLKLLNIDAPNDMPKNTHKSISAFEQEWVEARTYKRWQHKGNWYGFNNHSGVALLDCSQETHLCLVFREQYFDQTILLLYLRTTLFSFSRKLSFIIHDQQRQNENSQWLEQIGQLREEFSRFAILYQFPSLSNQQQAIEMYVLARACLDIDELYREVQVEIANTHDFLEQAKANELGEAANIIAEWGVPIAVTSLVISLFGTEICIQDCYWFSNIGIPMALIAGAISIWVIQNHKNNKGHKQ